MSSPEVIALLSVAYIEIAEKGNRQKAEEAYSQVLTKER
jgi:hypothetical protein